MFQDTFPVIPPVKSEAPVPPAAAQGTAHGPGTSDDEPQVRFALHDIADAQGRVRTCDLLLRGPRADAMGRAFASEERVSRCLANALLEGLVAGRLPVGQLLVTMDEACLFSPIAATVTPDIGAIVIDGTVPVTTPNLMRVAQLRSAGIHFCIEGLTDPRDHRWLWAPYADTIKLDLSRVPPELLGVLASRAQSEGLEVVATQVQSMAGYQRLAGLGVELAQGPFIAPAVEHNVAVLPGCDVATLGRAARLLENRVSLDALGVAIAADPALLLRLQLVHRLYGARLTPEPESLPALLKAIPAPVLAGWLHILQRTTRHGHQQVWVVAVRRQVEAYRQALQRRLQGRDDAALRSGVWQFQKRLCGPSHYLKALRFGP